MKLFIRNKKHNELNSLVDREQTMSGTNIIEKARTINLPGSPIYLTTIGGIVGQHALIVKPSAHPANAPTMISSVGKFVLHQFYLTKH